MPTSASVTRLTSSHLNMTSSNSPRGSVGQNRTGKILRIPGPLHPDSADDGPGCDSPRLIRRMMMRDCAPQTLDKIRDLDTKEEAGRQTKSGCCQGNTRNDTSDTYLTDANVVNNNLPENSISITKDCGVHDTHSVSAVSDNTITNNSGEGKVCSLSSEREPCVNNNTEISSQSSSGPEMAPVLKRKPSLKDKSRSQSNSISKSVSVPSLGEGGSSSDLSVRDSRVSSTSSGGSDTAGDTASPETPPVNLKRRISFPADSVLTAVIQDGDIAELIRILTGRHGPGLVHVRGEGGVMRGVDVCQTNHVGLTALHHAVLANNLDAAKLLLCHGADVNAQDVHGFSPLHTAAACGFLPLTSLLLLFGADVFSLTSEHELPIDVAKELSVVRVLSAEMTRLVHQELWVTSALRTHAEEVWLIVRKLLACVLLFILHVIFCVRTAWKKHRKSE